MKRLIILCTILVLGAFALWTGNAFAATETNDFTVTANVVDSCSISAGDLAFGNYDPTEGADVTAESTISITCSSGTSFEVELSMGADAVATQRKMLSGANLLNFNLFTDAAWANIWDDGTTSSATGTGDGANEDITVYGKIPSGQNTVPVGAYSETITASILY